MTDNQVIQVNNFFLLYARFVSIQSVLKKDIASYYMFDVFYSKFIRIKRQCFLVYTRCVSIQSMLEPKVRLTLWYDQCPQLWVIISQGNLVIEF